MATRQLTTLLHTQLEQMTDQAQRFQSLTDEQLNWRMTPDSWSILECLRHLNLYGDFYIPEIQKAIRESRYPAVSTFHSGWLGNYFAQSMLPKDKLNKMKTFTNMNPINSALNRAEIQTFLKQQEALQDLLSAAEQVNLMKTRTGISITKLIRLRLGDTFRFVIHHAIRHIQQAHRVLQAQEHEKDQ